MEAVPRRTSRAPFASHVFLFILKGLKAKGRLDFQVRCESASFVRLNLRLVQQTRVYPCPLGAGSARPNPKMGAPAPENPLFQGFSVLGGGLRPWSQTMVSEGARPWGRGRPEDCDRSYLVSILDRNS